MQDRRSPKVSAIIYAAKSTADPRGSIATQLADCRAAAEATGHVVIAEYSDEAASAYSSSRGPGLAAAREHAQRLGGALWGAAHRPPGARRRPHREARRSVVTRSPDARGTLPAATTRTSMPRSVAVRAGPKPVGSAS